MNSVLIFMLGLVAGGMVILLVCARREAKKHNTSTREELAGICASAVETASKKEERKQKALSLLEEHGELGNAILRKALGVSRQSVTRYMDELEAEGSVKQVGGAGQNVRYRIVNE